LLTTPRRHLYAFVHPLFWPWLWFPARRLEAWQAPRAKRDVLSGSDRFGQSFTMRIGDAPPRTRVSLHLLTAPPVPHGPAGPGTWRPDIPEAFAARGPAHLVDGAGWLDTSVSPRPMRIFKPHCKAGDGGGGPRHAAVVLAQVLEVTEVGNGRRHDQVRRQSL